MKVCLHIFQICSVWLIFSRIGLYFASYNSPSVLFLVLFCNKFEVWWLYQSSTVKQTFIWFDNPTLKEFSISVYRFQFSVACFMVIKSINNWAGWIGCILMQSVQIPFRMCCTVYSLQI